MTHLTSHNDYDDVLDEDDELEPLTPEAAAGVNVLIVAMERTESRTMGDLMAYCQAHDTTPGAIAAVGSSGREGDLA